MWFANRRLVEAGSSIHADGQGYLGGLVSNANGVGPGAAAIQLTKGPHAGRILALDAQAGVPLRATFKDAMRGAYLGPGWHATLRWMARALAMRSMAASCRWLYFLASRSRMMLKSVVLAAPFGPTSAVVDESPTLNDTSSSNGRPSGST